MMDLLAASEPFYISAVFAFALIIGSFLNVVIFRLPVMMEKDWREQAEEILSTPSDSNLPQGRFNLLTPRSRCPSCGKPVSALQNIPVLSYLLLQGRCAGCGTSISVRYPIVELASGIMAAVCAWHFGFGWEAIMAVGLTFALIVIALIDADTTLIPDSIVLPLLWVGLSMSLFHPLEGTETLFIAPKDAIIGALAGYLSLWSVFWLFKLVTKKDGMGYGDFKLLGALGAWLGWQQLPLMILLSAVVGACISIAMIVILGRDRSKPIPFGPYLAAAGWIAMLWGEKITATYLNLLL